MSTPEQAVTPENGWRDVHVKVEGLGQKVFAADGMLSRLQDRIRGMLSRASPDRGPADYDEVADERRLMMSLIRELARNQHPGPGSSGGAKHSWIGNALLAIILGLTAWTLKATLENTTAIAVLQCQVNPQACPQVSRGQNP